MALVLLASLDRHRTWDSLRNYSRLAALDPRLRERRLQALVRFPMLTAPVLLSAHERLDLAGGKRHAWRGHDDAVVETIDRGRDLSGILARAYEICKGLVRAPICAVTWGSVGLSHRRLLRLLDRMPAHSRPRVPEALGQGLPLLISIDPLPDHGTDLRRLGQTPFRGGLNVVCGRLNAEYPNLGPALADCQGLHPGGLPPGCPDPAPHAETRGLTALCAGSAVAASRASRATANTVGSVPTRCT